MTLFGFFRFSSLETQTRFNTDAIFIGAIAAILILGLLVFAVSRLLVMMNDVKVIMRAAMTFTEEHDRQAAAKIEEGKAELGAKIEGARQELGNKIDHVSEAVVQSAGGSGVNLGRHP